MSRANNVKINLLFIYVPTTLLFLSSCSFLIKLGTGSSPLKEMSPLTLTPQPNKTLLLTWSDILGESEYHILKKSPGSDDFSLVGRINSNSVSYRYPITNLLPDLIHTKFKVLACNSNSCVESNEVTVGNTVSEAAGYLKGSNTENGDMFGENVAISGDGKTLAVASTIEDSNALGINGDQSNNSRLNSGAVYIFTKNQSNAWEQQAYIKASNSSVSRFGWALALSYDGNTLAVGTPYEGSDAQGINGDQENNDAPGSGAVYVFKRLGTSWTQEAYIKSSNSEALDLFGGSLDLDDSGNLLVVGAYNEGSDATGVNGDQNNNNAMASGAAFVFKRIGSTWTQEAYLKASNTEEFDLFGYSVKISGNGNTLAIGATGEASNATGVNGDQSDNSSGNAGAVYIFKRSSDSWEQEAYVKSFFSSRFSRFGTKITLDYEGKTLAIGIPFENGNARGINQTPTDYYFWLSGAVYVYKKISNEWTEDSYIKASNAEQNDYFGFSISLSRDGKTLVVGAVQEDGSLGGLNANQNDNGSFNSGAVYIFKNEEDQWIQTTYLKANITESEDQFGQAVSISADGKTLVIGSPEEYELWNDEPPDQTGRITMGGGVYIY